MTKDTNTKFCIVQYKKIPVYKRIQKRQGLLGNHLAQALAFQVTKATVLPPPEDLINAPKEN